MTFTANRKLQRRQRDQFFLLFLTFAVCSPVSNVKGGFMLMKTVSKKCIPLCCCKVYISNRVL